MGIVKDKMTADLVLGNSSDNTKEVYLRIAAAFVRYYRRAPEEMGEHEVRAYLLNRMEQVKPATVAIDQAAITLLYKVTLDKPQVVARIPWPKVPKPLPDVLSGSALVTDPSTFGLSAFAKATADEPSRTYTSLHLAER